MADKKLTRGQRRVLDALLGGKTRKQIAAEHGCDRSSTSQAIARIRRKLGVGNDIELGAWAERNGLMKGRG